MSDTRREFERAVSNLGWAFDYIGDGQYGSHTIQFANKLWQACQSLNDQRIEQLLAVIAKKDEALQEIACMGCGCDSWEYCRNNHGDIADEALALQPSDVELSVYGYVSNATYSVTDAGTVRKTANDVFKSPVYTIKTKADKK